MQFNEAQNNQLSIPHTISRTLNPFCRFYEDVRYEQFGLGYNRKPFDNINKHFRLVHTSKQKRTLHFDDELRNEIPREIDMNLTQKERQKVENLISKTKVIHQHSNSLLKNQNKKF